MTVTLQRSAVGACALAVLLCVGVTHADIHNCSDVCTPDSDCGRSCLTPDGGYSTCGGYGVCNEGGGGCTPNWQYNSYAVGGFSVTYYSSTNYCTSYVTWKHDAHDANGCQPDYSFCTYGENGTLWEPWHHHCCSFWWCGGSGSSCPG